MEKVKQKKKDTFFNRNKFVMLSGVCALAVMLLVFYCYDLIPFGKTSVPLLRIVGSVAAK